tara:strand:+ start:579 stop:1016 length:438 start_codon:yes stop_codon:yes gene_type:complete
MKYLFSILSLLILVGCSTTNLVEDKISITGNTELVKMDYEVCSQFKNTSTKVYSCASAFSKNIEISKDKSLVIAKSNLIDTYNSVLSRKQSMGYSDNAKGITLDYDNQIKNEIDDTLVNYSIEFTKTFTDSSGYRTFSVISLDVG